jgi:flagellar motility protein MotE (MotC chaperone)
MRLRLTRPELLPAIVRAALQLAVGAGVLCALLAPAAAQQGWEPVVVAVAANATHTERAAVTPEPIRSPAFEAFITRAQVAEQTPATTEPASGPPRTRKLPEATAGQGSAARQYCINIADKAAEARFAWQRKTLLDLEQELAKRIAVLEAKTAEYQTWVVRRDEFVKKARDNLVLIYARMRPDAAAQQLMAMDEETAAAVLIKLDPRTASIILNEMDPAQAARLTGTIGGAARTAPSSRAPARPEDKRS